jgi:hypothetical protein
MAKAEATVEELVSMIERGELRLPEMQRRYVWRSTRVRDLMDSLYRGYPSGAILLWETDEDVALQDFSVSQQKNNYSNNRLLLDGQQRLTSLSAVIRGEPVSVRGRKRPIDLLFNLDHPDTLELVTEVDEDGDDDQGIDDDAVDSTDDELQQRFQKMTFVVATNKLARLPNWVSVTAVFASDGDAGILQNAGVTGFDDPRYKKYSERLAKLRGVRRYVYRMDVLERSLSYEEVTEIFVRVNSLGAKLRSSDLALAQITAKWRNSLTIFQEYQGKCLKGGFELDLGLLLKNLIAFATGQSRFQAVNRLGIEQLQEAWKQSMEGMDFALNFIKSNVGITSPALLSSPFLLITVAMFGASRQYSLSSLEEEKLGYWVRTSNAKGRYSRGSTETLHDQDLATIRDKGNVDDLIKRLRNQVGSLSIAADELAGRNRRSALFKTMFLAFKAAGAKDWISNLSIAVDHAGSANRLQFHHIFPKAYLREMGYSAREADDIANLSFIGGKTNRKISAKAPSEYLEDYVEKSGAQAFAKQCIPLDKEMLTGDSYRDFLQRRRELIAERLNEYLKIGQ